MNAWHLAAVVALATASTGPVAAQDAPRPGAPGATTRRPAAEADVAFMQGMIPHHAQALDMTALVVERTTRREIRLIAERIEVSQRDEIAWMTQWLQDQGAAVPDPHAMHAAPAASAEPDAHAGHDVTAGHDAHAGHTMPPDAHAGHDMAAHDAPAAPAGHDHALMPGMLSPDEMAQLAAATGPDFDRLFLQYMIRHHQGALLMVEDLLAAPGGGQATAVFRFASDVEADQTSEIGRMTTLLDVPPLPAPRRAASSSSHSH